MDKKSQLVGWLVVFDQSTTSPVLYCSDGGTIAIAVGGKLQLNNVSAFGLS
eukprot:m.296972 g.296972  ORF g.296972 m.296972 type:complete len:51 (-) comp27193_c3_seq39:172-324(-)